MGKNKLHAGMKMWVYDLVGRHEEKIKIIIQMKYIGLDGDSIGRHIERMLIEENLDELERFSTSVKDALSEIEIIVNQKEGKVIFSGGDSILFRGDFDIEFAENILKIFHKITGRTASIGLGESTSEAYLGLKLAKSKGGNQVFDFEIVKTKNQK